AAPGQTRARRDRASPRRRRFGRVAADSPPCGWSKRRRDRPSL
ncbi:MAG: hypothetical protein AVDCRST_MAG49-279, partial [uncultured Thermomicrobiales bacterium]